MSDFNKLDQSSHALTEDQLRHMLYAVKSDKGWSDRRYSLIKDAILKARTSDGKISQHKVHEVLNSLRHEYPEEINHFVQEAVQTGFAQYIEK